MIIFNKAQELLLMIDNKNNNSRKIIEKGNFQRTYIFVLLNKFEELGIIEFTTTGNKNKYFILTEKGKQI